MGRSAVRYTAAREGIPVSVGAGLPRRRPARRRPAPSQARPATDARRRGRPRRQIRDPAGGRALRLRLLRVPRAHPLLSRPALGLAPGRTAVRRDRRGHPALRARPARGAARGRHPRGPGLPGVARRGHRRSSDRGLTGHGLLQPLLHPRGPARPLHLRCAARGVLVPAEGRCLPGAGHGRVRGADARHEGDRPPGPGRDGPGADGDIAHRAPTRPAPPPDTPHRPATGRRAGARQRRRRVRRSLLLVCREPGGPPGLGAGLLDLAGQGKLRPLARPPLGLLPAPA